MRGDSGTPEGVKPGGLNAQKLEELITESIAKGVKLGIAKALSVIESWSGTAATPTKGDQGAVIGASSSAAATQPPVPQGSAPAIIPATIALATPAVGQALATASSFLSFLGKVHSIIDCSQPPQIPGRPGLNVTLLANPLDHLVPQKVKDKIWVREYVELSTLLGEEDQEIELQISSLPSRPLLLS